MPSRSIFITLFWKLELELVIFALIKATITSAVLSLEYPNLSLIAFPAITVFIYIQDRIYPATEDKYNDPDGYKTIQKYKQPIERISIIAIITYELLILTAAIAFFQQEQLLLSIITLTITQYPIAAYIPYSKLKQYLLLDTIAVSTSWAILAVTLPQIFTGTLDINQSVIYLSIFFFFGETALVELYNIPDIPGDTKNNKATLPTQIGKTQTLKLVLIFSLIAITALILTNPPPLILGLGLFWLLTEYYLIKPKLTA